MKKITRLLDNGAATLVGNPRELFREVNALATAAAEKRKDIVLLLLDRGVDINTVGSEYGTALAAAAFRGSRDIVSLLLVRGADIDAVGGKYGTALAAAAFGSRGKRMVPMLLDQGADINAVGGEYGTALAAAAFRGSRDIVSLLLVRGADINVISGKYGTALAAAAFSPQGKRTLSMLLAQGANINAVGGEYGTALAAAAFRGSRETVSLLLARGADINLVGDKYGTALAAAAFSSRDKRIVSLFLAQGADINTVGGEYGTALAVAAFRGEEDIVLLLLGQGADINSVSGLYGTPLAAAAFRGKEDIVLLLLARGADINAVAGKYGTALAAAAFSSQGIQAVSVLLNQGADIHLAGGEYGTALSAAAFGGNMDVVALLLNRKADINAVSGKYGTALAAAAFRGNAYVVSRLLEPEQRADINLTGGEYGTALAAAAYRGNKDIASLILDRGADINAIGGEYGTALAAAAYSGNEDIVSLLLDRGADINAIGGEYGTALAAAALRGRENIASLLLDRGANIHLVVNGKYGTALSAAVFRGKKSIVSLLLDRGADIQLVGGKYGTALAVAAFRGKEDIVSLLLDRGADVNAIGGEYGTALAVATFRGWTDIAILLLEHGADVIRVGGSYSLYSTTPGLYPSALDVAQLEGSRADSTLLALLETETRKQNGLGNQPTDPNVDPVDNLISRPPFPMPYTGLYSTLRTSRHKGISPSGSSSYDTFPTKFPAGGNLAPEQADVPCRELNEEVLWRSLTALVGLDEDTVKAKGQWIRNDIHYFVACNFDFGLAYAAARVAWKHLDKHSIDSNAISIQRSQWHKHAQVLDEARSKAIEVDHSNSEQELIISPYLVMPRRLWDLRSNRVVEFRMLHAFWLTIESKPTFWAVSHSWTRDMSRVSTAINQYQWSVPLPKRISLDYLRSELLTLGAEYVWIDIVCLRQRAEDDHLEQLRQKEWKLDVPTIGNIYRTATNIVRYFNGLGVRFSNDDWDDQRHWLHRAWTLQEIATENITINGGTPRDQRHVFLNSRGKLFGEVIKLRSAIRPVIKLAAQVDSSQGCEVYELAREMTKRHASKEVDKLSGLFYLLHTTKLPCYDDKMTSEDIWRRCFHLLPTQRKAEILFDFPYRGSDEQWFPTWSQVLNWPVRDPEYDHMRFKNLPDLMNNPGEMSFSISQIWTIPDAILNEADNPGEYTVEIRNRLFTFYLPYLSQRPIDLQGHPVFTLAIIDLGHAYNWVVCKNIEKRAGTDTNLEAAEASILRKVGVMRTDACGELLVGGENGVSLLQKMDCLFV